MIEKALSQSEIEALFAENAVFAYSRDVVPEYSLVELFGDWVARYCDEHCVFKGYLSDEACLFHQAGRGFNLAGVKKIVTEHNERVLHATLEQTESGKLITAIWNERCARLDELDRQEEEKRKARAAARKARQAAKQQQTE